MPKIAVIGAGITGVTSAYALREAGYDVVVLDRHRYPAMETSYANGGQLSASNAEVWNSAATIGKAFRWLFRPDAPLSISLKPSWHKFSWIAEFIWAIRKHRENTITTVRLAIEARKELQRLAGKENIAFDYERRGILHICRNRETFESGLKTSELLLAGGLERSAVTPQEIAALDPALARNDYYGGFYTPSDASGDIHKFTVALAAAAARDGVTFLQETTVTGIAPAGGRFRIEARKWPNTVAESETIEADAVVICAGVESRRIASSLGDRINIYPVKGYSITIDMDDAASRQAAPHISLLDEQAKIVASRLGSDRYRIAGTAELNGFNRDIRADRIAPLQAWVRRNFPGIDTEKAIPWAGLRPMTPDMLPVVKAGRQRGVFYNTGHGHLGWTLATATAGLLVQAVESASKR